MDIIFVSAFALFSVAVSKSNGTEKCKPNESYLVFTAKIDDIMKLLMPQQESFSELRFRLCFFILNGTPFFLKKKKTA